MFINVTADLPWKVVKSGDGGQYVFSKMVTFIWKLGFCHWQQKLFFPSSARLTSLNFDRMSVK